MTRIVILWVVLIACALVQIGVTHHHRQLLQQWQAQDELRIKQEKEHSKLLLERSTLGAHNRIDRLARDQLNMSEPQQIQVLQYDR